MILLIDNYDSFAHNLARYFRQLGQAVKVVRNDKILTREVAELNPSAIIMSPGPCTPNEAGICLELVREFAATLPMLGVCLGHQAICQEFGGEIGPVAPFHGRFSELTHFGHDLFRGIESAFIAGRYHSLVVQPRTIPRQLEILATSADGIVMAVAHRRHPIFGVQFHPESILTPCGYRLLANFLQLAKIPVDDILVERLTADLVAQTTQNEITRSSPAAPLFPHHF